MRKKTIKLDLNRFIKLAYGKFYDTVERVDLIELIKLDYREKIKIGVAEITMRDGCLIEDIKLPKNGQILDVFKSSGNKHVIMVKSKIPRGYHHIIKYFDMDLIWDQPSYGTKHKLVFSCTGEDEQLRKLVKYTKLIGKITSVSFQKTDYHGNKIDLTDKQSEIFGVAKEKGYYEYPRRINGTELAKELGLSKPTLIEHMRKIEKKVMMSVRV